ncbi:metal-dependent hydrolase family protein [Rubrimonas cliftonensis]|uniref:Imidazolonepropionase n=1 Tax=Rubrimonas cliftonensis TaxID=89524 RepID=A0A1H4F0T2_9RHOB|nr:amidohydrolase family protein [Rubrimonas cliftonensis]SEA90894.1 Imidazolonepropionase [Rubrimonas cliftonensis]
MKRLSAAILSGLIATTATAQDGPAPILIQNVRIFDGVSETLIEGQDVLVENGMISKIGAGIAGPDGAEVIDAGGRVMTPGFIYMHEHIMMQASGPELLIADDRYLAILASRTARQYLDRGITTIRDAGGNSFGLQDAIDAGVVPGPRIYPAGAMISQSSGHADHLFPSQPTTFMADGRPDRLVRSGDFLVVDGVPEILKGVREQLRRGATQIKIAVGGGTGSIADPLEVMEFRPEEIRAATEAAADFQTYVMAHVYNSDGIRRAIDNGVRSIEHANLIDRETMQYMKDNDVWLSPQVTVYTFIPPGYTDGQADKHRQAFAGLDNMFSIAREIGFDNIVLGSDVISSPKDIEGLLGEFEKRAKWFSNLEVLRQATSNGGELLALSGVLNPYPGELGVIAEGAHADLLLFDGNPLEDLNVIVSFEDNMDLIMKAGEIHKNTIN